MTEGKKKLLVAAAVIAVVLVAGTLLFQQIPATVSAPLFILVVIIEAVIAPIPGGAIGYLGAARFGFWQAWPLLYIGNIIGTALVFMLARKYGTPLFEENTSVKTRQRYDRLLEGHASLLWFFYTVPLIPVDVLSVLAGLSHMSKRKFFTIAFTGYFFYTGIVAYVGSSLAHLIGITEALSALGAVFVIVLGWWLWEGQKRRRAV
ncbi:MAG: TVP38/TMEM64 family protein [Gemmatimonadota bacterium]